MPLRVLRHRQAVYAAHSKKPRTPNGVQPRRATIGSRRAHGVFSRRVRTAGRCFSWLSDVLIHCEELLLNAPSFLSHAWHFVLLRECWVCDRAHHRGPPVCTLCSAGELLRKINVLCALWSPCSMVPYFDRAIVQIWGPRMWYKALACQIFLVIWNFFRLF